MKMSGRFIATKVNLNRDEDIEHIRIFTSEAQPVILVENLEDLEDLDIDSSDVEVV
jgi:hypothetical protein